MIHVTFRFYAELNDFLPPERRQVEFVHALPEPGSVKDAIESLGVPHTELDLILANGESVDFGYRLADGDRIAAYPVFESLDVTPLLRVRPEPLRRIRFVLDTHLGRLAAYLRLLGFDTLYANDANDEELAHVAAAEARILLTRDRGLLKRRQVTRGYCLRSTNPREQLREVVQRFDLAAAAHPFTRCLACNGQLRPVPAAEVRHLLPENARQAYDEFGRCAACGRVYWQGAHYERLRDLVEEMLGHAY
jgi:uncharacterized protein with PIN domain